MDTIEKQMFDAILKARGLFAAEVFAAEGHVSATCQADVPRAVREFCKWFDEQGEELLP